MIKTKLALTKKLLIKNKMSCMDFGTGSFLNDVVKELYYDKGELILDFNEFKTESWERARRVVLEKNPDMDLRTKTIEAELAVINELRGL